jgi:ABC-2 type transport system ATP-binding protein
MERLCDRVAVIHRGALIALERGVNLRAKSLRRVEMRFATPVPMDMFFSLPNLEDVYLEENKFSCVLRGDPDA